MDSKGWYNGYDWNERNAKLREMNRRIANGEQPRAVGPCALCGDPHVPVEYHDEDYSLPYLWGCRHSLRCVATATETSCINGSHAQRRGEHSWPTFAEAVTRKT